MFSILSNRIHRVLAAAVVPAGLGLVLVGNGFAQAHSQLDAFHADGPGGSGYCLTAHLAADDDGPGLGGGYASLVRKPPVARDDDGPGLGGGYAASLRLSHEIVADSGPGNDGYGKPMSDGPGSNVPYALA